MKRELLDQLQAHRSAKQPVVLVTDLATARQDLICPEEPEAKSIPSLYEKAGEALRRDRCLILDQGERRIFLQPFNPPLRMIIVGAVHVAQALCHLATESGYQVIVVDPRGAFASMERFPGGSLSRQWPDEALRALAPDYRTAVVTLTHDPKLDEPALAAALRSEAFYVGALGSRRTQAARLERLRERGFADADLARVRGPVGLDIGAQSPVEIAISILAQVIQILRQSRS